MERSSQRLMVDRLTPYLFSISRRYAREKEDARDILQESLIKVFNHIDQSQAKTEPEFLSWTARICVNTALSKIRSAKQATVLDINSIAPVAVAPDVTSTLNLEDILKLLREQPENQRLVFNLVIIEGYSHKEVAELLDIKESSSRTFLMRARKELQLRIQPQNKRQNVRI